MRHPVNRLIPVFLCGLFGLFGGVVLAGAAEPGIGATVEGVVDRLCGEFTPEQLEELTSAQILERLTPEEKAAFTGEYWIFKVDRPAVISLVRDKAQKEVPFWMTEQGFERTDREVRNSEYAYEVWQKKVEAGTVRLGINGFDMHRPHYVVVIGPREGGDPVKVTPVYPADQTQAVLEKGAFFYHDWTDLLVTEAPEALRGQVLLQTIRGRAREAHLIDGFRKTPFPASPAPDEILLTWPGDPRTTMAVQWRTDTSVDKAVVRWKKAGGSEDWREKAATKSVQHDRRILNNPTVHHFTALLEGLAPGTEYRYTIGVDNGQCSEAHSFTTAPAEAAPFSFLWLSDTHNRPENGEVLQQTFARHPEAAFLTISGDLVNMGQFRNLFDELFGQYRGFMENRPIMPCIGNHDAIDGLGADLYLDTFALPVNGPAGLAPERAYSFRYGAALFLMLDVTDDMTVQTEWMRETLRKTDAPWKVVVLHFPPYCPMESDLLVRKAWEPVWDEQQVDLVLAGHVHHYLRTRPLRAGKIMPSEKEGTTYMITVSVSEKPFPTLKADYLAAADSSGEALCVVFTVDPNTLKGEAQNARGEVKDSFVLKK